MKMLEVMKPVIPEDEYKGAKQKENCKKNRSMMVLPQQKFRVLLMTKTKGSTNDYVNAVWVNVGLYSNNKILSWRKKDSTKWCSPPTCNLNSFI